LAQAKWCGSTSRFAAMSLPRKPAVAPFHTTSAARRQLSLCLASTPAAAPPARPDGWRGRLPLRG
jgi:hypothetical protein